MIVDANLVKLRRIDAVKPVRRIGKLDGAAILDDRFGGPTRTRQQRCQDRKVKAHRSTGFCLRGCVENEVFIARLAGASEASLATSSTGAIAKLVMPGLVPGIHVLATQARKTWMAGTSPAMT